MSVDRIWLSTERGKRVAGQLHDQIRDEHLEFCRKHWGPHIRRLQDKVISGKLSHDFSPTDYYWDWSWKLGEYARFRSFAEFCITKKNSVEGMMLLGDPVSSRTSLGGQDTALFLEYLAVAPWNREKSLVSRRFRGVGSLLICLGIRWSRSNGCGGRLALHSVPGALDFYHALGFRDFGPVSDRTDSDFHYMELDERTATGFLERCSSELGLERVL